MTVNDIPLISFFQRVLDPLIIMGTLYLSSMYFGEAFNGYSLVLMILVLTLNIIARLWIESRARRLRG